jgi:hypothetical protein
MPVIIQWTYADGTKEIERIPAEIWRLNEKKVNKVFIKDKEVTYGNAGSTSGINRCGFAGQCISEADRFPIEIRLF